MNLKIKDIYKLEIEKKNIKKLKKSKKTIKLDENIYIEQENNLQVYVITKINKKLKIKVGIIQSKINKEYILKNKKELSNFIKLKINNAENDLDNVSSRPYSMPLNYF
ncbi:MAG: hypothetical protein PHR26_02860 [Candidatus ainarchaeum sp.]|nr:hypothetical protein [Candidatus ainarchaeum sp.]